ncbi:MAG TPA: DUF5996 family protein [Candidatus Saccharimonadales bacterium]|nr:DUF5996 family protein [Candidatus Saccharimonadales bacterium]
MNSKRDTSSPLTVSRSEAWPALPMQAWQETYHNLHMWTQIVGKVRLELTDRTNHWWNVPLYLSARGLTTSPIPYGNGVFEIQFDFLDHKLLIDRSDGARKVLDLVPRTVADFYAEFMAALRGLGIEVTIYGTPVELAKPIPFAEDQLYRAYDAEAAHRFWRILVSCDALFKQFRARFLGKNSPVQFFWGSFDLAVTRFSGRRAPERPGADPITREAYSHEVISAGWWPGGSGVDGPAFYCYAAPEPPGLEHKAARPEAAFYHPELKEFILMYDRVRAAGSPEQMVLEFLQSTYEAAAELGGWNREELETASTAA